MAVKACSGLNMHRARHTFATELRRVAGVEAASQALGHSDLSTTLGIYGHQDQRDLERTMDAAADAREAEEAASRGKDSPSRSTESRDLQERWRRRESNPRRSSLRRRPAEAAQAPNTPSRP